MNEKPELYETVGMGIITWEFLKWSKSMDTGTLFFNGC